MPDYEIHRCPCGKVATHGDGFTPGPPPIYCWTHTPQNPDHEDIVVHLETVTTDGDRAAVAESIRLRTEYP